MANLKEERNLLNARWKSEKEVVDNIQNTKQDIEQYKLEAERAEREGDYGKVAEIRYGKIKDATERLEKFQVQLAEQQENALIKEEVTYEDIADVVAKWTGIPVTKMMGIIRFVNQLVRSRFECYLIHINPVLPSPAAITVVTGTHLPDFFTTVDFCDPAKIKHFVVVVAFTDGIDIHFDFFFYLKAFVAIESATVGPDME